MLELHNRASLIPSEPGVSWHSFIKSRFVDPLQHGRGTPSLAVVVHTAQPQSQTLAEIRGLMELSSGSSLPVVSEFVGLLNLESREISIRQIQPEKNYAGQVSENGLVIVLREVGQSKPIHLIHEETLAQLV
jgi:hypothetical protein